MKSHRILAVALWAIALLVLPLVGQQPPIARSLSMISGRGELVRFANEVTSVSVAEPKIADVIVVSPHDVTINAKTPGHTTVFIWETGSAPVRYDVTVTGDTVEAEALHKAVNDELKKALPSTTGVDFTGNAEVIVLSGKAGTPEESKRAEAVASAFTKKVVNLIEIPDPRQIQLQVKFASVDRGALNNFGINLVSRNPNTVGSTGTQQFQGPLFSQLQFQNQELQTTNLNISNLLNLFLFRPDLNIGATIQALQNRNLMQILAEPNLIVTEGKEASFLAGGEFPYPTVTSTPTQGGIAPVVTVQFKKFGVQLNFAPSAAANGAIKLKVKPEVSSLDFNNAVSVQGVLIPAVASRYAETEVVLKDGESFAIAGLIDNRVTQVLNRIRGFGDIPVLGHLFRSRATNKSTDELMVVITPHVILPRPPGEVTKLPETTIEFQPKAVNKQAEQQAKKDAKKSKQSNKPEFSGDRGHEVPK